MKTKRLARRHLPAGFTLIELMITVGIVAILTAIAYPNYRNYVIRGQLVDATNGLSTLRANMERYYQDNRTYATTTGNPVFNPPCLTPATVGNFKIWCPTAPVAATVGPPATPSTYTATATGNGNLTGFNFSVDQNTVQSTTISAPAPAAWIINCPSTWSTKPGSC